MQCHLFVKSEAKSWEWHVLDTRNKFKGTMHRLAVCLYLVHVSSHGFDRPKLQRCSHGTHINNSNWNYRAIYCTRFIKMKLILIIYKEQSYIEALKIFWVKGSCTYTALSRVWVLIWWVLIGVWKCMHVCSMHYTGVYLCTVCIMHYTGMHQGKASKYFVINCTTNFYPN